MSLHPLAVYLVPEDTARVAHAAFPKGNRYLALRDEFGAIFEDRAFTALFSARGRSAIAPAQLALVTILQFAEGLSDLQAADAVRARIDWKYLLSLELDDYGFDASVLCELRARLLVGEQETLLLDTLLAPCRERGLLKARGQQRTDSTHVLAAVRALNRLEVVGETLRHTRNSLAVAVPEWLRALAPPEWGERYARRAEDDRLPAKQAARAALALTIGADGFALLAAAYGPDAPAWLREVPAVATLRRVWVAAVPPRRGHDPLARVGRYPALGRLQQLAPRRRRPRRPEAHHAVGGVQSPSDRDVRPRTAAPDHQRGDHGRADGRWRGDPGDPCRPQGTRPPAEHAHRRHRLPRRRALGDQSGRLRGRVAGADPRR